MALDFPYPPTLGQTFAGPGGVIWTWDNVKWVGGGGGSGGGGSSSVVVSPTPPAFPTVGQLWWDSTGGQLYIRYEDPNTQQWVTTHNIGFGVPLNVPNGGTGIVTYSQGDLLYGSAPDTLARLTKSTATTRYLANTGPSNNPAWDQVNVANGVTGILPIANGGTGNASGPAGPYLPLVGGTMTGNLTIKPASGSSILSLDKVPGQESYVAGMRNGVLRWRVNVCDAAGETGSNAGSNFDIQRHDDAGTFIDTPLTISRATGTLTVTGSVWVQPVTTNESSIYLNKPAAAVNSVIYGFRAGTVRWGLYLGNSAAESGGNAGSDFALARFNDAGSFVENPILIPRSSGVISLLFTEIKPLNMYVTSQPCALRIGVPQFYYGIGFRTGDVTSYFPVTFQHQGDTQVGTIACGNTSTAYNTTSDGRLKEDLKSFDAGPIIDAINVYDFAWKINGERSYGVVAQEVVEVYPQAITHDEISDNWGTDYSQYMPIVLQELKALRARVAALEGAP